ncbi:MAG: dephospho-CoA kinase [Methanophagales archaeon]|nr:dephospho-CoA kinase [Methanophagales archaeon]
MVCSNIITVGLSGGVASGKSLVLQMFMNLGAYTIDCDLLSREAVIPCSKAWWEVVRLFGSDTDTDTDIVKRDLEIDRKKLRRIVFGDARKRAILEEIIHPEVRRKCVERIDAIKKIESEQTALVVVSVPLLIETGMQSEFDKVIIVYASEEIQIRRVMEREEITRADAEKMIRLQMPLKEKLRFADIVITNEGTWQETEKQVRTAFATLFA